MERRCNNGRPLVVTLASSILYLALLLPTPTHAAPRSTRTGRKEPRYALVIAPVGDAGLHNEWLKGARSRGRNWDLAAIYYGDDPNFTCQECRVVRRDKGAKWQLLYKFLKEQKGYHHLAHKYAAIMVADDDLRMSATDLNEFFDAVIAFNLTVAQPSLCPGSYSYWWNAVGQRDAALLHYTNFVELMAPTFSGVFFDTEVRKTMGVNVHSGWGLDFVWPYLAGWGKESVAVLDSVCMQHISDPGRPSRMYINAAMPRAPPEEWDFTLARYNLTEEVVSAAGFEWKVPTVFGELPREQVVPKANWRKRLDRSTLPIPYSISAESHSGVAVFVVMVVAVGGLLVTGAAQTRRGRRTSPTWREKQIKS